MLILHHTRDLDMGGYFLANKAPHHISNFPCGMQIVESHLMEHESLLADLHGESSPPPPSAN